MALKLSNMRAISEIQSARVWSGGLQVGGRREELGEMSLTLKSGAQSAASYETLYQGRKRNMYFR